MNNEKRLWVKWVVLAACMFLAAAGCIVAGIMGLLGIISVGIPANTNGGHLPGTEFNFYAGPVMPLSASGDTGNLQADREITFDYTGFGTGSIGGSAKVTDRYYHSRTYRRILLSGDRRKKLTIILNTHKYR